MSVLDKFAGFFGSAEPVETIIEFGSAPNPVIENSAQLFSAEFERDGADLVLSNFGQPDIRIPDYFGANKPADIHTADGKVLAGDVVEKLAGPEFPAQYAQAGTASDTGAIGQVESISGTVTVQRASGVRVTLSVGAKVFTNDVVQTGDGGALSLTFLDGTIFTLAESSRMVLDSLIYDPASSENSGIFNLVEGSFVFIAGQVAKTGGMEVKTPAATMGIRGTTVLVKIVSNNGVTEVEVSLNQDPDGTLGQFTITGLDGTEIANVDSIETKWLISPVEGQTREITRTPEELSVDQTFLGQAFGAYRTANQRVNDGGEFVETDASGPQSPQNPENLPDAQQDELPDGPTEETPENDQGEDDRRGELGSGLKTELAIDTSKPESSADSVVITQLISGGEVLPVGEFIASNESVILPDEQPIEADETESLIGSANSPPEIEPPAQTIEVLEDGSVILNGFNIADPEGDILTATITAGSTLTLSPGSGVTLLQGTGIDEEITVIQGTGEQITNALNGAVYKPDPDADVAGSLTVEVTDSDLSTTDVMNIPIIPVQDAPVALPDTLTAGQNDTNLTGNLLANDYDVDTNPAPDQLSVISVSIDGVNLNLTNDVTTVLLTSGAKLTVRSNGSYTFDTNNAYGNLIAGQVVSETIGYTISDGHEAEHGKTVTGQLNVAVTGVNDSPVFMGDGQISVGEAQAVTLTQADLHASDVDHSAENLVYTVTSSLSYGQLELAADSGNPITSFTQQQIDNGEVVYVHNGLQGTDDEFSFTVKDGHASVNGTVAVAISQINDDPSGSGLPESLTILEDTASSLDLRNLALNDPDAGETPVTLILVAENASLSAQSSPSLTITTAVTGLSIEGSIADLNAALSNTAFITLTPAEDLYGTAAATVSVSINDNGNTGAGGGQDIAIGTIVVNITAVNDAPVITATGETVGYTEDGPASPIETTITINDPDDGDLITQAWVRISENFEVGDVLTFANTAYIAGVYDEATGVLSLSGTDTAQNYVAALGTITFSSTSQNPSELSRVISYQVGDVAGEFSNVTAGASVTPNTVNDAPVLTEFPIEFIVDEDITQNINFYDLEPFGETFSDPDAANNSVELTFTLSGGVLTLPPGGTDVAISGLTLTGTVAAINNYLNNGGTDGTFVRFTTDQDSTETVDLNITIDDLGNTGDGGPLTDSVDLEIIVYPVDDAAAVTLSASTNDYVENGAPLVIDSAVSIVDVDSLSLTRAGVVITENYQAGSDVLAFSDTATITGSFDATTGVLMLNGIDTIAAYEAALSSVTYQNTSDNPAPDDRTIVFNVDDGAGFGVSDVITVTVTTNNDAPVVTISDPTQSYSEDSAPAFVDAGIIISDVDNTTIQNAEVTIGTGLEAQTDLLFFSSLGNITGSYDETLGILTLGGEDTLANYQSVLRSVTFSSSSDNPSMTDREIHFSISDGVQTSNIGTVSVSVTASNDAPGITLDSIAASAELISNGGFEEGTTFFPGGSILSSGSADIADWNVTDDNIFYLLDNTGLTVGEGERAVSLNGDEPGAIDTVINTTVGKTYEVSFQGRNDGTLDVMATGGTVGSYTFVSDSNGQYHSYTFTATAALTTLSFTSTTAGAVGPDLDDVTMREVVGATFDMVEDTPLEISDIQITDADATETAQYTVTLSSSYGLITVNPHVHNGLEVANITGNGTYFVTLSGPLASINTTLAVADGVIYTPNLDFNGSDSIEVFVNDGGTSGPGGPQTATTNIIFDVQSVSDALSGNLDIGDVVAGNVANLTGIQFVGQSGDTVGNSVSNVGDINDDGIDDFAIGSAVSSGESGTPTLTGSVYVIYGIEGENPYKRYANPDGEVNLDSMAADGLAFELVGVASGDQAGFSVSGGGDINNDGISDIVVGAHFVDGPLNSGAAYVVYGGQNFASLADVSSGEISLDTVGITGTGNLEGFEFKHTDLNAELGYDVNLTGDLNNDGISDLIVSSLSNSSVMGSGAWVIFGGQDFSLATDPSMGSFDTNSVGPLIDGFVLEGEDYTDSAGLSLDVVGDFNNDGIDDLLVGAPVESGGGQEAGASYLVYGGQDWASLKLDPFTAAIGLNQLGPLTNDLQGFKLQSNTGGTSFGTTVSSAGDVNGDGLADLLATAPGIPSGGVGAAAYLIYGGQNLSGTISTSLIGASGTGAVNGVVFNEGTASTSVTHATALGDIDGDGYSDILIGAKLADDGSDTDIGRAYIVYGSSVQSNSTQVLTDVGSVIPGFQISGEADGDLFGERAQSVGDVNSDGYNDFLITALGNDDSGTGAGAAYLLYGSDFDNRLDQVAGADIESGTTGRNIIHGTPGDDVINGNGGGDIITTGAGDDVIIIGNSFIDFIDAGSGTDTLKFGDSGSFDLTNINDLRLQSIEALNTTNGVVNDVTLSITDIFQISDDANANLETLLSAVLPTSFVIDADANDTYTFENGSAGGIWTLNTPLSSLTPDHNVYEYIEGGSSDVLATLAIDDDVTPTII